MARPDARLFCSGALSICSFAPGSAMKQAHLYPRSRVIEAAFLLSLICSLGFATTTTTTTQPRRRTHHPVASAHTQRAVPRRAVHPVAAHFVSAGSSGAVIAGGPWDKPTFADSTEGDRVDGEDLTVRRAAAPSTARTPQQHTNPANQGHPTELTQLFGGSRLRFLSARRRQSPDATTRGAGGARRPLLAANPRLISVSGEAFEHRQRRGHPDGGAQQHDRLVAVGRIERERTGARRCRSPLPGPRYGRL